MKLAIPSASIEIGWANAVQSGRYGTRKTQRLLVHRRHSITTWVPHKAGIQKTARCRSSCRGASDNDVI